MAYVPEQIGVPSGSGASDVLPASHAAESPIVSAAPVGLESTRVERASLAINAFLSTLVALTAGIVEVAW